MLDQDPKFRREDLVDGGVLQVQFLVKKAAFDAFYKIHGRFEDGSGTTKYILGAPGGQRLELAEETVLDGGHEAMKIREVLDQAKAANIFFAPVRAT